MRCLTLADALKRRGARIRFVSRHLPEHLAFLLHQRNHEFARLEGARDPETDGGLAHGHWLETSQLQDSVQTSAALSDENWDWIIVDHYALDARWERTLRASARRIAVIDDIADRAHDCDLLLDQNLHSEPGERYRQKVPANCTLLLGPGYAMLREEFRLLRERVVARDGEVARILIAFGGVDAANYTGQAVEAVGALHVPHLEVDVVVGREHPFLDAIARECGLRGFSLHIQTGRMAQLMAAADLAIGAGGTIIWERCCLGLPALAICVSDNQSQQIESAARQGLIYAPEVIEKCSITIRRHVEALIENRSLRHRISEAGMSAVDGLGVWRVADALGMGELKIRTATLEDARNVFDWRNNPRVRAASRSSDPIDWNTHLSWFTGVLSSAGRVMLIGERQGLPVGVVRFDIAGPHAEISIYLVPEPRTRGQGADLLQSAEAWIALHRPAVIEIRAEVLPGNAHSDRLFMGAGYRKESALYSKRLQLR